MKQTHGHDKSIVSRFERTYSGHFHHKNDDGQVYYLGNQYEMTWSDYNNQKDFMCLILKQEMLSLCLIHILCL